MALTYGFFNSLNGDRKYSADEMAGFLDGIVYDGVYEAVGNKFFVAPYANMKVTVDSGRAWFDHTWTLNTTKYVLELPESDTVYDRIDAVVLEINKSDRKNYFKVIKGVPAAYPIRPQLVKSTLINQYAFAYITVPRYSTAVTANNIEYVVDTSETPLCSALALAGIPSGGKTGYVLAKKSGLSGSVDWYNIDRLPYDDWMYPAGVTAEDVIAAFKFKGVESEAVALKNCNVTSNEFILSKNDSPNITWTPGNGIHITGSKQSPGYLYCEDLMNYDFKTVAVKYANVTGGNNIVHLVTKAYKANNVYTGPNNRVSLYAKLGIMTTTLVDGGTVPHTVYKPYPGVFWKSGNNYGYKYSASVSQNTTSGVLSCFTYDHDDSKRMYYNGHSVGMTDLAIPDGNLDGGPIVNISLSVLIGDIPNRAGWFEHGSVDIHAVVFFNRKLTDDEISRLHEAMLEMP